MDLRRGIDIAVDVLNDLKNLEVSKVRPKKLHKLEQFLPMEKEEIGSKISEAMDKVGRDGNYS